MPLYKSLIIVPKGGTGATTLTGLLLGNGTSAVTGITTSAGIAAAISDETGTGSLVFSAAPTLTGNVSITGASQLTFEGPAGDTGNLNVVMDTYYTNVLGTRFIGRHARGSKASPTATASGDELFGVEGRGHTGSGFLGNASAGFFLMAEEAWTTSKSGSSVIIQATDLGTNSRDTIMKVKGNYSVIITGRLSCNLTGVGASAGTGAGTGPTLSPSGSDMSGSIQVLTGTTPAVSSAVVTVTFVKTFDSNPYVVITPANAITASLAVAAQVYVTSSTTGFTINSNTTALAATTTYKWNYMVIQ
jgi:hypothetical protein